MSAAINAVTQSMLSDAERLRVIGHNMANVSTPGFRAERLVKGRFEAEMALRAATSQLAATSIPTGKPGGLRETSRPLDMAIDGPAYFQIDTGQGLLYTRRGDFQLDAAGRLVNEAGYAVVGTGGDIVLSGEDIVVDRNGAITQRGQLVGQLALVEFESGTALEPLSEALLASAEQPNPASKSVVIGKHLETSNVDVVAESIGLVETSRHASYLGQALRGYDQILNAAINTLGSNR